MIFLPATLGHTLGPLTGTRYMQGNGSLGQPHKRHNQRQKLGHHP